MSPTRTLLVSALVTFAVATLTVLAPVLGRQREHVAEHTSHPSSPVRRNAASQVELTRWLSREPAPTVADLLVWYVSLKPNRSSTAGAKSAGTSTGSTATGSAAHSAASARGSFPAECISRHESGGDYRAYNPARTTTGHASGKYQVTQGTWNNFGGYSEARYAPPAVQEQQARELWARRPSAWAGTGCAPGL